MDKGLVISQNNKMMTSKLRRNSKAKTSKLIVALQKDQSQRCCATVPHDSSSSSACSFAIDAKDSQDDSIPLLPPHQGTPLSSDSDQHFLEGLLVLAPDSMDALQVLMRRTHIHVFGLRCALVVDDPIIIRKSVGRALSRLDFEVDHAVNGLEGLEQSQQHALNVVLCDYWMPVMDGFGWSAAVS